MRSLSQRVLDRIRRHEFLHAGDRVGVAVSGGIDSVALLRLLIELRNELGIVLFVVHFNHKLRGAESDTDQEFVASLARAQDLEFHVDSDDVARQAREEHVSLEAAAREVRYGFFRYLLGAEGPSGDEFPVHLEELNRSAGSAAPPKSGILDKIVTAHTLDDQAETVLMRMIRGAGLRGLRGIHPRIAVEDDDGEICGEIIRPLLGFRRCELEQYLRDVGQPWREDSTNAETKFTRNRVRQKVLPLLEKEFNPSVAENLVELAEIAQGEEDYWENEIAGWMGTAIQWSEPEWPQASPLVQIQTTSADSSSPCEHQTSPKMNATVSRIWLLGEPVAVQRRVIKAIGDEAGIPLEFRHVEEIIRIAGDQTLGAELALPRGWKLVREPESLLFFAPNQRSETSEVQDYQYELHVPGRVLIPETATVLEAIRVQPTKESKLNLEQPTLNQLLDAELFSDHLQVRNWRPGDRFWPAHTKSPKKIKELLQQHHVAQRERKFWPVVVSGNDIVWVRGFPPPQKLHARPGREAVLIREMPLGNDDP